MFLLENTDILVLVCPVLNRCHQLRVSEDFNPNHACSRQNSMATLMILNNTKEFLEDIYRGQSETKQQLSFSNIFLMCLIYNLYISNLFNF